MVRYEGQVFRFIFAAKQDNPRFAQGAAETLRSFHPASQAEIAALRQVVVETVVARSGETADNLAARMASVQHGAELFYILNNLYPGDPLVPGQSYKIVAVK